MNCFALRDTIAVLVGSESLAEAYVEQSGDVYMARGHLAPKADFMYTSWQVIISGWNVKSITNPLHSAPYYTPLHEWYVTKKRVPTKK